MLAEPSTNVSWVITVPLCKSWMVTGLFALFPAKFPSWKHTERVPSCA